jgi:hypothetical protein
MFNNFSSENLAVYKKTKKCGTDRQATDCNIYVTAIGLTPGSSSAGHIYTQTIHKIQRTEHT